MAAQALALTVTLLGFGGSAAPPVEARKFAVADMPQVGENAPRLFGIWGDGDTAVASRPWEWDDRYTLLVFWSIRKSEHVRLLEELRDLRAAGIGGPRFHVVAVATSVDPKDWDWRRDDPWEPWIEFQRSRPDLASARIMTQIMETEFFGDVMPPDPSGHTSSGRWGVRALPVMFLVGPDGRLVATDIPRERVRDVVLEATAERR